ncbi:LCP family protein [Oceanobacillus profundus]|uniref:LytR family transcriptional regulator n=1 Tax=Oceanobacillus profundus TaxID=372463 RepID=A0A417YP69_9BACI|nr:LCP family protein [Oceanobacillus profundus]RHW35516.1 LytR family transcriptional regulator [Oceanobacillus profundus]
MSNNRITQTRIVKRHKRKIRKKVYFILLPILIAFLSVLGYGTYLYIKADTVMSDSYVETEREKSPLRDALVDPNIDNVSVLIMGIDSNDHRGNADSARTDALMLATFNKDEKSVNLLSIPRDSLVYIPEVGYEDKINHAHYFGGTTGAIETVENLLDIPVDYYVKVNFHAFVDVVDALGGISVDVPYEFKESDSMDKRDSIHLMPGVQDVGGEEALALARTRKLDNDIERGKRQQEIMKAVINKATSLNSILNYDDLLEAVGDNMTTNMTFSDMKTFITYGTKGKNIEINTLSLEGYDYQPANKYYWALDQPSLEETKALLQDHLEINSSVVNNQDSTIESTSESY